MEAHVKKCIDEVKTYCKPNPPSENKLERELKAAARKFDMKEVTSSEITSAFLAYEKHMREKFKDKFKRAERSIPYKTSSEYIKGVSSDTPENAAKAGEGSGNSKRGSSGLGTKKPNIPRDPKSNAKKDMLDKLNASKGGKGFSAVTPPSSSQEAKTDDQKKAALHKLNKEGKRDGKATPTPRKVSGVRNNDVKIPSRDSTVLEIENWKKKLKESEEEMNSVKKQLKMVALEFGIEGETSIDIITGAARQLKSVNEQKNKDQTKRRIMELETSLESVKKAVFKVQKVKDRDHDLEKTKAKIQDLHSQGEELLEMKEAVLNPNKRKDMKDFKTDSKDAIMERIHELQRSEQACLELQKIIFDEELKKIAFENKLDESQHSTENAKTLVKNLKSLWRKTEADKNVIFQTVLGKEVQPTLDVALEKLRLLKRDQNDLQDLLKTVSDTEDLLNTKQAREEVQKLKKHVNDQNDTIQKQTENLTRLEIEISNKKEEISEIQKKYDSMRKNRDDVEQRLNNDIKRVQAEKNNALTRLSEVAGAKLTNENPHITDLSDPNRPIKIGEQYSELYDNTWTDVFEKLTEERKMSDKEAIHILLQILENSYSFCKTLASKRYKNILAELTLLRLAVPDEKRSKKENAPKRETTKQGKEETVQSMSHEEITVMQKFFDSHTQSLEIKTLKSVLEKIGLNETDLKYVKNLLKMTVEGTCRFVEQDIWKNRFDIQKLDDAHLMIAQPYLKKCVRICWLMVAQDPPVCLKASDKKDMKFNKDFYREFTSSGKKIDYVVWPALLLHEDGPLLKKGVAQPKT